MSENSHHKYRILARFKGSIFYFEFISDLKYPSRIINQTQISQRFYQLLGILKNDKASNQCYVIV